MSSDLKIDSENLEWTRDDFKRAVKTGGVPLDEAVKALLRARSPAKPKAP